MSDLRDRFGEIDIYVFDQLLRGRIAPGMRVVDMGCGGGRNLVYLLQSGYEVFGIDGDPLAIQNVRQIAASLAPHLPPDHFRAEAIEQHSLPEGFADVVISSAVLHFARDDAQFMAMLEGSWKVLKRGGLFVCRVASSIGMEDQVTPTAGRRHLLPDGSERYLVDAKLLTDLTRDLGGELVDPLKTTIVQDQRCMTTWVMRRVAAFIVATVLGALAVTSLAGGVLAQSRSADVAIPDFERTLPLEELAELSAGVSAGDLNGDGWLDIVLAKGRHTALHNRVLLGDGKGHFNAADLGDTPDRSYSAELADLDADGDLDVVTGNDLPDRKLIFKNDGKGTFIPAGSWGEPSWPTRYVTLADLNGDAYPDIVAANAGASMPLPIPYPSFMCLNDKTGAFPSCRPLPTESAVQIVAADFDANGTTDLFVGHRDGGRNYVLWNAGPARFAERTAIGPEVSNVRIAAVADFNGDGRPDVVMCDDRRKSTSVFLNAGGRAFHEPVSLPTGDRAPYAVSAADVNQDSKPDIVVGYLGAIGSVFLNSGNGRSFVETTWNDGQGDVYQIAFGDFDRDGSTDIVAARSGAPNGIWFNSTLNPVPAR